MFSICKDAFLSLCSKRDTFNSMSIYITLRTAKQLLNMREITFPKINSIKISRPSFSNDSKVTLATLSEDEP